MQCCIHVRVMGTKERRNSAWRRTQVSGGRQRRGATQEVLRSHGNKKQLILMYTGNVVIFHLKTLLCILQTFISLPTVCARVCVCILFYFLPFLNTLFGFYCSVCIIGRSLIFLLSCKWRWWFLFFFLLEKKYVAFCLTTQSLISPYEKGWNL